MLGDPRSGSNVCEPPDRQIGKSGEDRGQIVLGNPRKSFVGHISAENFALGSLRSDDGQLGRPTAYPVLSVFRVFSPPPYASSLCSGFMERSDVPVVELLIKQSSTARDWRETLDRTVD